MSQLFVSSLPRRNLRTAEVLARTQICKSSLYKAIREQRFPAPHPILGTSAVAWFEDEVDSALAGTWMPKQ